MSSRITFGSIKQSISRVLGANTTDARVAEYVSRAQERLLYKGKYVGTYGRYRVCVNDACLTWPREIETIEAAAVCGGSVTIRNGWYEFLGTGPGVSSENCGCAGQLIDREDAIAFDDVKGTGKKLAIYCDDAVDAGLQVLIRYYDSNGNKYYSTVSGVSTEGEYLTTIAPPGYVYSTNEVMPGGFYGVIKPASKRMIRVYEYTVTGGALRPLAYYEPDETLPVYRRSLIPGLSNTCNVVESDSDCGVHAIDVVGKFRHRAVSKDSDELIIQSGEALRLMVQSIRAEEDNLDDLALKREASAMRILDEQLSHWMGSGAVVPLRIVGAESWGGGICNIV